jgi:hypothetical protein
MPALFIKQRTFDYLFTTRRKRAARSGIVAFATKEKWQSLDMNRDIATNGHV